MDKLKYAKSCDVKKEKDKAVRLEYGNGIHALSWCHILFERKYSKYFIIPTFPFLSILLHVLFGNINHKLTCQLILSPTLVMFVDMDPWDIKL